MSSAFFQASLTRCRSRNTLSGLEFDRMSKPNWENRTLFHGDNLEFLRAMNSSYGSLDRHRSTLQ